VRAAAGLDLDVVTLIDIAGDVVSRGGSPDDATGGGARSDEWLDAVQAAHASAPFAGVIADDDDNVVAAARAAARVGLPFHTPAGAESARHPLLTRGRLIAADLPIPWFVVLDAGLPVEAVIDRVRLPLVVRRVTSGPGADDGASQVRVDAVEDLRAAVARVRRAICAADAGAHPESALLVEGFVDGRDFVLEGVMQRGQLLVLAILAMDPSAASHEGASDEAVAEGGMGARRAPRVAPRIAPPPIVFDDQRRMAAMVVHGALAMGLRHGPLHAVCRVGEAGLFLRRIAGRPVGEPWASALRFVTETGATSTLDALLLRHAAGEALEGWGLAYD
jgi:hypothetical protein